MKNRNLCSAAGSVATAKHRWRNAGMHTIVSILIIIILAAQDAQPASKEQLSRTQAYYHFLLGTMKEREREYGDAIDQYREALKYDSSSPEIFARLADLYLQTNRIDDAVKDAQQALQKDPQNKEAHKMLGQIYMEKLYSSTSNPQDLQRAIGEFEAVRKIDPEDEYAILSLGQLYLQNNKPDVAAELLSRYVQQNPDSHVALMSLASAYQQLNQPQKALDYLLQYTQMNPQNLYILQQIAESYEKTGKFAEALEFQKKAYDADADNPTIVRKYLDLLSKNQKYDEALQIIGQRAKAEPQKVEWGVLYAKTLQDAGQQERAEAYLKERLAEKTNLDLQLALVQVYEEAEKYDQSIAQLQQMTKAVELDATMSEPERKANLALIYSHMGYGYQQTQDYDRSIDFYRKAKTFVAAEEAGKIDFYIALSYRGQKKFDQAIDVVKKIVEQSPTDTDSWELLSLLYEEKGDYASSDRIIQQLIDKNPASPEYHILRGQRLQQREKYAESIPYLQSLLSKFPTNDEIYFLLGAANERLKKIDAAEDYFKKAIQYNPASGNALNYLGYMLIDNGVRLEESIEYIKRALELDRDNGAYLDSLGWGYFKLNKLDLAEDHLRMALERLDDNAVVHDHMGDLYFKQGKFRDAIRHWEMAIKQKSNEIDPAFIQKKIDDTRRRLQ